MSVNASRREDRPVAVVTGGCSGIGAGITRELAGQGMAVFATYHDNAAGAAALADELTIHTMRIDLASQPPESVIPAALDGYGRVDYLVNSAAVVDTDPLREVRLASVMRTLRVNTAAPLLLVAELARLAAAGVNRCRAVVNISSIAERFRGPDSIAYEASKAALSHVTRALAHDLAREGIRVNAVAPGAVDSARKQHDPGWDAEFVGGLVPWGRVGEPADIATVVHFLLTDNAEYLTGQVLYVDGGLSLRL